jgi:hypothetical protein
MLLRLDLIPSGESVNANADVANPPGFDPSILRQSGIRGAANEAVLNKVI